MKKLLISFFLSGYITTTAQATDRFAPINPNATYQEMQNRATNSKMPTNSDYLISSITNRVEKKVRENGASVVSNNADQAIANSVVVQPGANTGDIYVNIEVTGDTNVIATGRE